MDVKASNPGGQGGGGGDAEEFYATGHFYHVDVEVDGDFTYTYSSSSDDDAVTSVTVSYTGGTEGEVVTVSLYDGDTLIDTRTLTCDSNGAASYTWEKLTASSDYQVVAGSDGYAAELVSKTESDDAVTAEFVEVTDDDGKVTGITLNISYSGTDSQTVTLEKYSVTINPKYNSTTTLWEVDLTECTYTLVSSESYDAGTITSVDLDAGYTYRLLDADGNVLAYITEGCNLVTAVEYAAYSTDIPASTITGASSSGSSFVYTVQASDGTTADTVTLSHSETGTVKINGVEYTLYTYSYQANGSGTYEASYFIKDNKVYRYLAGGENGYYATNYDPDDNEDKTQQNEFFLDNNNANYLRRLFDLLDSTDVTLILDLDVTVVYYDENLDITKTSNDVYEEFSYSTDDNTCPYMTNTDTMRGIDITIDGNEAAGIVIASTAAESWVIEKEFINITVYKEWDDGGNAEGKRGDYAVTLTGTISSGTVYTDTHTMLSTDTEYTWYDLPMYSNCEEVIYTVTESSIPEGYKAFVSSMKDVGDNYYEITVTNALTTELTVKKVWDDNDNQDGIRPSSIFVYLTIYGQETPDYFTLSESNDWIFNTSSLRKYDDYGHEITYGVSEVSVDGYTSDIVVSEDGTFITITNTCTPNETTDTGEPDDDTVTITVTKKWDDDDDADGIRPDSITGCLVLNGTPAMAFNFTLSESNNWTVTISNMAKYDSDGNVITYSVYEYEGAFDGYTVSYSGSLEEGFVITNSHTPTTATEETPEDTTGDTTEETPEDTTGDTTEETPEDTTGDTAEDTTDTTTDDGTNTTDASSEDTGSTTEETVTETVADPVTVSSAETSDHSYLEVFIALMVICEMALIALITVESRKRSR